MTLQERLAQAHQRSVALYLERQQVEAQRQQIMMRGQEIDLALIQIDGEIALLKTLIKDVPALIVSKDDGQ